MRSTQCNVDFGYQMILRSRSEKKHGKPGSNWPVAGPGSWICVSTHMSGFHVRLLCL
jgi:hypothetical protein